MKVSVSVYSEYIFTHVFLPVAYHVLTFMSSPLPFSCAYHSAYVGYRWFLRCLFIVLMFQFFLLRCLSTYRHNLGHADIKRCSRAARTAYYVTACRHFAVYYS